MKQLLIFFLTILVFLISCNEKNLNVRYGVNLPDTINKRDTIGGVIFYKSDFDTKKRIIRAIEIEKHQKENHRQKGLVKDIFGLCFYRKMAEGRF